MILITGAAGVSGSAVIREFAGNNVPVRALVRDAAKAREFEQFPILDLVVGDMLRTETLGPVSDGVRYALSPAK